MLITVGALALAAAGVARYTVSNGLWGDPDPPWFTQHYRDALQFHLRGDAILPDGLWLFFGDSLIEGLPVTALSVPALNYGIGRDDATGVANRLPSYDSARRAAAVVLGVGITELRPSRKLDTIEGAYRHLLDSVPVGPRIVCLAVLPIDERVQRDWGARSNARIDRLNERLEVLCRARGHDWIDAPAALRGPDGNLQSAFHVGDGLHLGPDGNAVRIRHLDKAFDSLQ